MQQTFGPARPTLSNTTALVWSHDTNSDDVILLVTGETEYFELMVTVDFDTVASLTMGREKIEDILVLHLEGGKDFFVSFLDW